MKIQKLFILFFVVVAVLTTSCKDEIVDIYTGHSPVYMSYADLENAVQIKSSEQVVHPGKLFFKDHVIFMNEYMKGIHVLDNTNPSSPQKIAFISIPGNVDISVINQTLYADSYTYLLVFDISNIHSIKLVNRVQDVFPYTVPAYDRAYKAQRPDRTKGVVIGWELKELRDEYSTSEELETFNVYDSRYILGASNPVSKNGGGGAIGSAYGVGGSMARMHASNNTLYVLNNGLDVYDVSINASPSRTNTYDHEFDVVETIFQESNNLFIGTQNGVLIYNVENPTAPEFISSFEHATGCDPVVASGNYIYVTLRSGNDCGEVQDQLDVIDISNIRYPEHVATVEMDEPFGLGVLGQVLFVCDGSSGLKEFDIANPENPELINTYSQMDAYDIIPLHNELILVVGNNGLFQYSLDQNNQLVQIGEIPLF